MRHSGTRCSPYGLSDRSHSGSLRYAATRGVLAKVARRSLRVHSRAMQRVEGEVGIVHVLADDRGHLQVLVAHDAVVVLAIVWQALPAVLLAKRLVVLHVQVEVL